MRAVDVLIVGICKVYYYLIYLFYFFTVDIVKVSFTVVILDGRFYI